MTSTTLGIPADTTICPLPHDSQTPSTGPAPSQQGTHATLPGRLHHEPSLEGGSEHPRLRGWGPQVGLRPEGKALVTMDATVPQGDSYEWV